MKFGTWHPYTLRQPQSRLILLTSTVAAFLFSRHPKTERDQEVHLNYYARAYNTSDNYHTAPPLNLALFFVLILCHIICVFLVASYHI